MRESARERRKSGNVHRKDTENEREMERRESLRGKQCERRDSEGGDGGKRGETGFVIRHLDP